MKRSSGDVNRKIVATLGELVVKTLNDHSQDSDPANQVVRDAIGTTKRRAGEGLEETSRDIDESLEVIPECKLGVMPTQESSKKTVRRLRERDSQATASPHPTSSDSGVDQR